MRSMRPNVKLRRQLPEIPPSIHGNLSTNTPFITQVRTVIMTSKQKSNRKKPTRVKSNQASDMKYKLESKELDQKILQMQELAKNLKLELKKQDEKKVESELNQDLKQPIDPDSDDVDILYNEILGDDFMNDASKLLLPNGTGSSNVNSISLFNQPAKGINLPITIQNELGDSIKYLVSKENQNWDAVVVDLYQKDIKTFLSLPKDDVANFLNQIPIGSISLRSMELIVEMLQSGEVTYNATIYDVLMRQFAELNQPDTVKSLFDNAISQNFKPTKYMYGHLIKVYSSSKNLPEINSTLQQMYKRGIEPSVIVYTNVLKLCVEINDYNQADEIFQMMKFRSIKSKPDIETYNTMLLLTTKKNDVYRAFDLYNELLAENLNPTIFTLNCLAQVCSKNKEFILRGWKYIIEINERKLEPNLSTFEIMLRLAAKDGDLELARALYLKIYELRSTQQQQSQTQTQPISNESFIYLLMAYRDYKFDNKPQILQYKEGAIIRRNTMGLVDFMGLHQTIVDDFTTWKKTREFPPFLPIKKLFTSKQIIAESNAIWTHGLLNNPKLLDIGSLVTYLRIAVDHGDVNEFWRRYNDSTFANEDVYKDVITIEDASPAGILNDSLKSSSSTSNTVEVENQEFEKDRQKGDDQSSPPAIEFVKKANIKIERESTIYTTLLAAGRRFENLDMCEKAWTERGLYRKTSKFDQTLSRSEKKRLDFKFAIEMVSSLIALKLLPDAVSVVTSSQDRFNWNFYILKPLYVSLLEIGDEQSAREISLICSRNNRFRKSY